MDCRLRQIVPVLLLATIGTVVPCSAQVVAPPVESIDVPIKRPVTPLVPGQQAEDRKPIVRPPVAFNAAPNARDAVVARLISSLMPRHHVSSSGLNDTISERALDLFVDSLDPLKLYFYQSDIDEFRTSSKQIDDMVRAGDLSFAYTVFRRFAKRVDERVTVADEILGSKFDFTIDETIVIDPDTAKYATSPAEAKDRWRRQIKYALLDLKDQDKDSKEEDLDSAVDRLRRRYARYARRWNQTDADDILEMYMTAVTMGYDPHSTYMSPGTLEDFKISMNLKLDGIGAALREKDGQTVVMSVITGGAADLHGKLKPDDVIISVGQGQEDGEMVDIVEMPLKEVVDQIRGNAGTTVRLGVKPGGRGTMVVYKIVRARVQLEESAARGQVIINKMPNGDTKSIGFINLPSFYLDMEAARQQKPNYRSSTRDVGRILAEFREKKVDGVVLDLSKNGGGSLTEAINLTGLFIDRGPVVQVKNADGTVQQYNDDTGGTSWDGPLVVLTSKFSASASEIFAGAIQDYKRGIVVGDPATHGKGTVQTLMDIGQQLFRNNRANYGALKVTLQQFYLPDGQSTQLQGVSADVVLPSIVQKMDVGEGDLKYALKHDTVKGARHDMYSLVPGDLLGALRTNSQARVGQDKEFVDLVRRIELYVAQKEQSTVSLNEEKFMARRVELDAQKEDEKKEEEKELNKEEVYHDGFYNREVMNITHEYINGLKKQNLAKAG